MRFIDKLYKFLSIFKDFNSIQAFVTWPKFSITSYQMVSCLAKQGILPKTVIDVGANTGQFAIAASKTFDDVQIYSFEPVPTCVQKFQKNIASIKNITIYPFALGENEQKVAFHVNSYSQSSSVLPLAPAHHHVFPEAQEKQVITVKVSALDLVFASTEFRHPVLLKIDVQGYEARVILGGEKTLKRVDFVILEVSFKTLYEGELLFTDLLRIMEAKGFQFQRPVGWLTDPRNGEILQIDALFSRSTSNNHTLMSATD